VVAIIALIFVNDALPAVTPSSYEDALVIWERSKDTAAYQAYAGNFSQFNNRLHLDERDGCYVLAPGPVNLMLVITHSGNDQFAVIDEVLSNVNNAKARCFERTYRGVRTKIPPFVPFVLQMGMQ